MAKPQPSAVWPVTRAHRALRRRRLLGAAAAAAAWIAVGRPQARDTAPSARPAWPVRFPENAHAPLQAELQRGGLNLALRGAVAWQFDPAAKRYRIELEAWVGVGLIKDLVQVSEGLIDDWGLRPLRYTDRRLVRRTRVTTFEPSGAGGHVRFHGVDEPAPMVPGTQDRLSVSFQLAALVHGAPHRFTSGTEHTVVTAGSSRATPWVFIVQGEDEVEWDRRRLAALHVVREPRREGDQRFEAWLLPQAAYLPVRIRMTEPDGDFLDQRMLELRGQEAG